MCMCVKNYSKKLQQKLLLSYNFPYKICKSVWIRQNIPVAIAQLVKDRKRNAEFIQKHLSPSEPIRDRSGNR